MIIDHKKREQHQKQGEQKEAPIPYAWQPLSFVQQPDHAPSLHPDMDALIGRIQASDTVQALQAENVHLVLYIHGFHSELHDFLDVLVAVDKKLGTKHVVTTAFDWPCNTKVTNLMTAYGKDRDEAHSDTELQKLQYLLSRLQTSRFRRLDIVCHSMGNYLFKSFVDRFNAEELRHCLANSQIVSFAADVDANRFANAVKKCQDSVPNLQWTHYFNTHDLALSASRFMHLSPWRARAGQQAISDSTLTCITSIRCDVNLGESLIHRGLKWLYSHWKGKVLETHSYIQRDEVLNDLEQLIIGGVVDPSQRRGLVAEEERAWKLILQNKK